MAVPEFKDCSQEKILECLDLGTITGEIPVSDVGNGPDWIYVDLGERLPNYGS